MITHRVVEAAKTGDPVFVQIYAHGDLEQPSGLYIGTSFDNLGEFLTSADVALIHSR